MSSLSLRSPIGPLTVVEEDDAITEIFWRMERHPSPTPLLQEAVRQLEAYFAGELTRFDLPLNPTGSDFQQRSWAAMSRIPYGATKSYGELAAEVDCIPRAMGRACGTNPIPVIVPCHRVLAAAGAPGGYSGAGGLATKRFLLDLERGRAGEAPRRAPVQFQLPLAR